MLAVTFKKHYMGRAKELWMELQEDRENELLAEKLGLTYDELCETDWHIETDESNDGLIYGYIVYFHDAPKHILKKIIGLNPDNQVWLSPNEFENEEYDYYNYDEQFDAIIDNKHYYDNFNQEIENLKKLNQVNLSDELSKILNRQLYVSAIGTLETFLSDTFINLTEENQEYFKNFVETFPDFTKQKFQLNDIFNQYEKLRKTARKEMLEVIYHNLDKVRNMYIATFKNDFPEIETLSKAVSIRHDLVHRNGKTKDGVIVEINSEIINTLINNITIFVEKISQTLNLKG